MADFISRKHTAVGVSDGSMNNLKGCTKVFCKKISVTVENILLSYLTNFIFFKYL